MFRLRRVERRARWNLAIRAMAQSNATKVDRGGERNQATMTRTVNLHGMYLRVIQVVTPNGRVERRAAPDLTPETPVAY